MSWSKAALLLVAIAAVCAAPAAAQIAGRPIEVSGGAGYLNYDVRSVTRDGPAYTGSLGWRMFPWLVFEDRHLFGPSWASNVRKPLPDRPVNFYADWIDLRMNLRSADSRTVPYVVTGMGYGQSHSGHLSPNKLQRGTPTFGLGVLMNVFNQRAYLRLEARDVMFRERDALEFSNQLVATAGLHYVFLGKVRDSDLDGVRDWLDKCPSTPIGAKVDARGCPLESDGDGVYDGLDKCPSTPRGCKVDKDGCPIDSDGDGACDGLDQCPDTPKGAKVDDKGCPIDSDGDGVFDGLDQCPGTPKGCQVDEKGCPIDSDGDGVCDGLDQCPNTPAGLKVDPNGCPIEVSEKETELLDTGMIRLQNIEFDTGKASLKPASFPVLDEVGKILQQYPMLRVEIGGHTDNRGSKALNERLSQARADSVLTYVKASFPMIDPAQYTAKGYGFSAPIAPNTTELGRAKNRRVEFKVLNTEALKIEREKRHFLKKDEGAPPDTTKKQ
jgi:outer membrane protein OmpA-like peptidoglycan-associated protein